jgi:hypothetical protein
MSASNPFDFSQPEPPDLPPARRRAEPRRTERPPQGRSRREGGRAESSPNKKLIYILAGVLGGVVLLCCGGIGLVAMASKKTGSSDKTTSASGEKPGPDGTDYTRREEILTAEFYPFKEGTKRTFVNQLEVRNEGKVVGSMTSELEHTYESGNVIRIRNVKSYSKAKGDPEYHDLPLKKTKTRQYRLKDGYVETGDEGVGGTVWSPVVKVGAKAGDTWDREVIPGATQKFRVTKFEMKEFLVKGLVPGDKVFCAYVEITHIAKNLSGQPVSELVEVVELGRGVGPVSRHMYEVKNGRREEKWSEVLLHPSGN